MLTHFATFLGVSAIVIVSPGQDTALVVRNSLAGGRRGGLFTSLGVVSGQVIWTLACGAGLTALLIASRPAFTAVKFAGAGYLLWLGARSLYRAWSPGGTKEKPIFAARAARLTPRAALSQGLVSALGNAKLAVFYVSFFPQFMPHGRGSLPALGVLGLTFCTMTLVWLTGYSIVVGRAGVALGRRGIRRTADTVLGAALVAFGLQIASERR